MMIPNLIYIWFLISSVIMSFSSSSMFFLWMCLEINMMSFIPMMHSKNTMSMNSIVTYFLIQSTASSIFLLTSLILTTNLMTMKFLSNMIMISMLIKLGMSPFHSWLPQISEGLSYSSLSILLTIQKMIPLYILSIFTSNLISIFIILSATIGSLGGFNQFSIRKILAFSSISHLSWVSTLLMINSNFWLTYLLIYSFIILLTINFINYFSMNFLNFKKENSNMINLFITLMLLSLGGMPPMIGFMMKWTALSIIMNQFMTISIFLIMSSLINLFFYLRLSYTMILKFTTSSKWSASASHNLIYMLMFQAVSIFLLISMI
uniref:NADH-ubiquinone oxidoreductase chain 2 n=1 Tax=Nothoaspis amazoniensis TaxID=765744 RepID=W0FIJ3_9ACAR|nr:NADH dehydrogenase subunit 2 [Nothoaspis amazoniensis]AHF21704.1 NADH dehydrogenase subunit 2 [Nothoaspis amazoniensis]APW83509.1 NADH dehydrogenase subunit 2 [Nothoaspis amazoniensis]